MADDARDNSVRGEVRLFGAPEPEEFRATPIGRALGASAEIHFKERDEQDRLLALEKLALDIFDDPLAGRAFAVNPQEYMRRAGFEDVTLDLNSPQVRVAMALGDPDVRRAAQSGDVDAFVEGIRRQGIDPDEPLMPVVAFEIAAVLSAVAVTWAAVGYSIAAGMMVYAAAALKTKVTIRSISALGMEDHVEIVRNIAAEAGGDQVFQQQVGTRVVEEILARYADLHARVDEIVGEGPPTEVAP